MDYVFKHRERKRNRFDQLLVFLVLLCLCHDWLLVLVELDRRIHCLDALHDRVFERLQVIDFRAFNISFQSRPPKYEKLVEVAHVLFDFLREMCSLAHVLVVREPPLLE